MKTNCWMILGAMLAASAIAQDTRTLCRRFPRRSLRRRRRSRPRRLAAEDDKSNRRQTPAKAKESRAAAPKKTPFTEPTVSLVPGPAEVAVTNFNVRGQAGLKGEFIAHIKKGDAVTVLSEITLDKHKADEPAQWAKIALPASVKVWVARIVH